MPCFCGDSECPSCGLAQETLTRTMHSHFCPDCNGRYQCERVGCEDLTDEILCDPHFDAATEWPRFDPDYERQRGEL